MSLRHLRRTAALQQGEQKTVNLPVNSSSDSLDESSDTQSLNEKSNKTNKSIFLQAASAQLTSSEEDEESESSDSSPPTSSEPNAAHASGVQTPQHSKDTSVNPRSRRSRSKNRRKRNSPAAAQSSSAAAEDEEAAPAAEEAAASSSLSLDSANEAEAANELCSSASVSRGVESTRSCLYMERAAFDVEADLRRIFGREIMRTVRVNPRGSARSRRHWLVSPVSVHPFVHPWVRMIANKDESTGFYEFSLEYTEEYMRVQPIFYAALHSHDLLQLQQFCRLYPHHPDSLLALSQAFLVVDNQEASFNAISAAVASLQAAFHYSFSPFAYNPDGTPRVCMDCRNPLNRVLFASLLIYMIGLGRQSCFRSALEVCKLLISLDIMNEAEYSHAMLHLDHFAIRSEQFEFLQTFSQTFPRQHITYVVPLELQTSTNFKRKQTTNQTNKQTQTQQRNLKHNKQRTYIQGGQTEDKEEANEDIHKEKDINKINEHDNEDQDENFNIIDDLRIAMPNFAFSAALAFFLKQTDVNLQSIRDIKAADICAVYGEGRSSLNEFHIPHLALMHAILLFPSFIRGLLEKLNIKGEQKIADSIYSNLPWDTLIFSAPLWSEGSPSSEPLAAVRAKLLSAFLEKNFELWKAAIILRWVHSCAAHLHQLCLISEEHNVLRVHKERCCLGVCIVDISRYSSVSNIEFKRAFSLPEALLIDNQAAPTNINRNRRYCLHISLRSSPLILFFQTLLPCSRIDHSGLHAQPIYISTLLFSFYRWFADRYSSMKKFIYNIFYSLRARH